MKKFLRYIGHYWWQVALLFAGLGLQVWSSLELPDMMSQIVNQGIVGGDQDFIIRQGLSMLVVTLVGGAGMLLAGFLAARIGAHLALRLREDVFKTVMSFSIS
ncbi:MAG: hypothetical protein LBH36_02965 [Candidatus Nomurabacteria bacterium]|jgi:ATP-binding cassette subfamily B protein|nr:hypothetical protein [Candidatus Nomurabacteria bacterium]